MTDSPRTRRWWALGGVALLLSAAALGLALTGGRAPAPAEDTSAEVPTAEVARTDLVQTDTFDATLGYGATSDLTLTGGTITQLAPVGATLERGSVVAKIDGRPVVLFIGDTPLWRELSPTTTGPDGVPVPHTVEGDDVKVLQQNLIDLGFGKGLKVNGRYDSATIAAVQRWHRSLDQEPTGVVQPSDVAVRPAPVRVAKHTVEVGSTANGPALTVTGTQKVVTAQVEVAERDLFTAGDPVKVKLPDRTTVDATVFAVGTAVTPTGDDPNQTPKVEVLIAIGNPAAAGDLDEAPVKVLVERSRAVDVLAVPVNALLALAEGGYALEVVDDGDSDGKVGGTHLVGVEVGQFANGLVEVTPTDGAPLEPGDRVEVPR